jgi:WD40 repeat protein
MPEVRPPPSVLIVALAAFLAISATAQTQTRTQAAEPKIDVVLQLASSLSEDEPYVVYPQTVSFSLDQRRVASGDTNGVVKLWNVADGRLIRAIGHPQQVTAVAFSPDGRRLVTAAGTIRSWDAETGRLIHNFEDSFRSSAVLAVSSDGLRVVAGSDDAFAREWDVASGRKVREYVSDLAGGPITAAAFSPDRRLLATAHGDGAIRIWNAETAEPLRDVIGHRQPVGTLAFSPDGGRLLSSATDGSVSSWDIASGRLMRAHEHSGTSVLALWTDWTRARTCCNDAVVAFDLVVGGASTRAGALPANSTAAAFSRDGSLLVIAARDGTLRLVAAESGQLTRTFNPPAATTILSIGLSPDGKHVVAAENGSRVQVWDISAARLLHTVETQVERSHSIGLSYDGRRFLAGDGIKFELREVATGSLIRSFDRGDRELRPVLLSPDGRLILAPGPDNASLALWNVDDGRLMRTFAGDLKGANWAAFSADGRLLATDGEPRTIRVWETATGRLAHTLTGIEEAARPVGFSADGRRILIAGSDTAGVRMLDIASGKRIDTPVYPEAELYRFSSDGRRLLALAIEEIRLVATGDGRPIVTVAGLIPFQIPGAFLPDGRSWLSGSYDTTLTLRDVNTGGIIRTLAGHTGAVIALSIARDGKRAVSGSPDTTIRLWDLETGVTLATLLAARNGEWIIVTPEGFYSASPNGSDLANVVSGFEVFPLQRFDQLLHRPDLVVEKIAGDPRGAVRDALAKLDTAQALAAARRAK